MTKLLLPLCVVLSCIACTKNSSGYDDLIVLYKESVEVMKSKDKSRIEQFIRDISPDKGTFAYMNKGKCSYRGIPEEMNDEPELMESSIMKITEDVYQYVLKKDKFYDLDNLVFVKLDHDGKGEMYKNFECPEILFYEGFVKCSDGKDNIRYSFGEFLKVNGKWKAFTGFKD